MPTTCRPGNWPPKQPIWYRKLVQQSKYRKGYLRDELTVLYPMKIGYAHVSTRDQNLKLQLDALNKAGCETIY